MSWGAILSAAADLPWLDIIGTGAQVAGTVAPLLMDQPGQQQQQQFQQFPELQWTPGMEGGFGQMPGMQGMTPGMQGQLGAGGASMDQVRRRLSDTQSQGLSGASPDFLAAMAGVTPQELEQMLGLGMR